MIERVRVRCPNCRAGVPVTALWASGDICPRCSTPLNTVRRPPTAEGTAGRTAGRRGQPRTQNQFGLRLEGDDG